MSRVEAAAAGADAPLPVEVCEQAMQWWLDLQEADVDARALAAFAQWRGASRTHELAWQRAQALASQMSAFRQAGDVTLAKRALLACPDPAISRRRAMTGLAVLLAAAGGGWSARDTALVQQFSADYHTGVGEQQRVVLSSQLELLLNTRSAVNARRVEGNWHIDLLDGEVLMDTTATAPLLLRADPLHVSTTGARFSTRRMSNGAARLAVLNGTVQVRSLHAPGTLLLKGGEQVHLGPRAVLERSALQASTWAWSEGMIVAHGQPLQAFLEDVARYRRGHLGCDDALSSLPVWGTYPLADTERIIAAVADTLKLDVQRFTRLWVNLRQPSRSA